MVERLAKERRRSSLAAALPSILGRLRHLPGRWRQPAALRQDVQRGADRGYVLLKPDSLRSYGCEALTTADVSDPTALLASEKEHTIQHELQHVFDKIIYVESALRTMDDATGQTQSNLLGMEYRARLAEMAFTHDLGLWRRRCARCATTSASSSPGLRHGDRVQADRLVYERMRRCTRGPALRRLARRLIDLAYRQAYGLTLHSDR